MLCIRMSPKNVSYSLNSYVGVSFLKFSDFSFNSTRLPHKSEETCPPVASFQTIPCCFKEHTHCTLHHTLLTPSCLPTVTHQLAQSDICYVPLFCSNPPALSPLWVPTDMQHSLNHISLLPTKGEIRQPNNLASIHNPGRAFICICKTLLSNHVDALSHSLPYLLNLHLLLSKEKCYAITCLCFSKDPLSAQTKPQQN